MTKAFQLELLLWNTQQKSLLVLCVTLFVIETPVVDFTNFLIHHNHIVGLTKLRAEPIVTYDHLLTLCNITMCLDFFPCKTPIPYDASYVYDACNVLVKSYSKSIVATTHGIVLVKSSPCNTNDKLFVTESIAVTTFYFYLKIVYKMYKIRYVLFATCIQFQCQHV